MDTAEVTAFKPFPPLDLSRYGKIPMAFKLDNVEIARLNHDGSVYADWPAVERARALLDSTQDGNLTHYLLVFEMMRGHARETTLDEADALIGGPSAPKMFSICACLLDNRVQGANL